MRKIFGFVRFIVALAPFAISLGCHAQGAPLVQPGKLTFVRQIRLEETGDSIITSVTHVCFSPNGLLTLITDAKRGTLEVVDTNGSRMLYLRAGPALTDSLVARGKPFSTADSFVFTRDLPSYARNPQLLASLQQGLKNRFKGASFVNDSECVVGTLVRARMFHGKRGPNNEVPNWTEGRNGIIRCNLRTGHWSYSMLELGPGVYAAADDDLCLYTPWNEHVICTIRDWQALDARHLDSAYALAEYSQQGTLLGIISMLTPNILPTGIGYGFSYYTGMTGPDHSAWFSDGISPMVWNPQRHDTIALASAGDGNSQMLSLAVKKAGIPEASNEALMKSVTMKVLFAGVGLDTLVRVGICEFTGPQESATSGRPHHFLLRKYNRGHADYTEALLEDSAVNPVEVLAYNAARDEYWAFSYTEGAGWGAKIYKLQ